MMTTRRHWMPWIEAVAIPMTALALSFVWHSRNPLFLDESFPWLWLAPTLVALRYGVTPGLLAVLTLMTSLFWRPEPSTEWLPAFTGLILLTLICGEYSDVWTSRRRRSEARSEVLEERMTRLTDDLYVARISQERLEQNLIYKPISLRSALQEIKHSAIISGGTLTKDLGEQFLYLLNQTCGVQSAGIYVKSHHRTPLEVARFGDLGPFQPTDPVYLSAIEHQESRSLVDLDPAQMRHYLAIYLFDNVQHGHEIVLAVSDISFFSLNEDNIRVIGVIFRYFCNHNMAIEKGLDVLREWPDCPDDFAVELTVLAELNRQYQVTSTLLVYTLHPDEHSESLSRHLCTLRRGLDIVWRYTTEKSVRIIFLLPFSGAASIDGHMARVSLEMNDRFGESWQTHCTSIHDYTVGGQSPAALLHTILPAERVP
uniref:PelD GGDEF domain-containing protein n=1 Tax=Acidithiobacillus ferrianus TaxID=2678518 RepID=A0A845U6D9_9PROT|nr:hypothetical protein [Acidithiobacillus ferrianus]